MSARRLVATINGREVGHLASADGIWAFHYSEAWLKHDHAHALSPHLPLQATPIVDGSSIRPVQWYFDNLLPEEGQRVLLSRDAGIDAADTFGLLAHYGAESAGSLTLLPLGAAEKVSSPFRPLDDSVLSARIGQLPRVSLARSDTVR